MQVYLGLLLAALLVVAAESAGPATPAEVTSTSSGTSSSTSSSSGSGDRRGRLLLLLTKKALAVKAPFLIAKGIGAKAGFAGATVIKGGAVAGASGLAGLSGLSGLAGLSGLSGVRGGGLVSAGVGSGGRLVYVRQPQQYYGGQSLVTVAKPIVVTVPYAGYQPDYYENKYYDHYDPKPDYYNDH